MSSKYLTLPSSLLWSLLATSAVVISSIPTEAVIFRPTGDTAPKKTTGGASRGGCFSEASEMSKSFTPLIPNPHLGFTLAERPTLFVYIPVTTAKEFFLSLQDENGNHHYQAIIPLGNNDGVAAIKLPEDAPPLELGKTYKWSLAMICGEYLEPDSPEVTGWIRRVSSNESSVSQQALSASLERVTSLSKANSNASGITQQELNNLLQDVDVLAQAGVWYDSLSLLANLRQVAPHNPTLITNWQELLISVGLDHLATQPLLRE